MPEQDGLHRVQPPHRVREDWDEAFSEMAEHVDDRMLDEITETEWENEGD